MSRSGILEALHNEERSLRNQLVAIQRAIEAIEGNVAPAAGRGRKKAAKAVRGRKRAMSDEQRRAVAERMRKYWAARREAKAQEEEGQGVTRRTDLAGVRPASTRSTTPGRIRAEERTSEPPATRIRVSNPVRLSDRRLTGTRLGNAPGFL